MDIAGNFPLICPRILASRKSLYVTMISHAIRSLWVPVGLRLSSFSQTLEKPGTVILYVGVAGNFGLSAGNSGLRGLFSEATTIDRNIFFSFVDRLMTKFVWRRGW